MCRDLFQENRISGNIHEGGVGLGPRGAEKIVLQNVDPGPRPVVFRSSHHLSPRTVSVEHTVAVRHTLRVLYSCARLAPQRTVHRRSCVRAWTCRPHCNYTIRCCSQIDNRGRSSGYCGPLPLPPEIEGLRGGQRDPDYDHCSGRDRRRSFGYSFRSGDQHAFRKKYVRR